MGDVTLVGAGPGDAELLTVKAMRALHTADVVVYDRLVSAEILALIPDATTKLFVGKFPSHHPSQANSIDCNRLDQRQINQTLVNLAKQGKNVVRLKGGDPMIYGRAQEEIASLQAENIKVSVIPGITSAQGVAAQTLLSLTCREFANKVILLTAHQSQNKPLNWDWQNLTDRQATLVIYMGMTTVSQWSKQLMAFGLPVDHPVLAVSHATTPKERRLLSCLGAITVDLGTAQLETPTLFIVGDIVRHYQLA